MKDKPHGNSKRTKTCKLCKREMDKYHYFYSPEDDVCKDCNSDWVQIKKLRKLAREKGVQALQGKLEHHKHMIDLVMQVVAEFAQKGIAS